MGLVGRTEMDRLRHARLRSDQGTEHAREAGDAWAGRAFGPPAVHSQAGWRRLAVQSHRIVGRPAADALRAGRVARAQRAVRAPDESRAQVLEARRQSDRNGRRLALPVRDHDLPPDGALLVWIDEPLESLAQRIDARALH